MPNLTFPWSEPWLLVLWSLNPDGLVVETTRPSDQVAFFNRPGPCVRDVPGLNGTSVWSGHPSGVAVPGGAVLAD